jgi:hypothetical protein
MQPLQADLVTGATLTRALDGLSLDARLEVSMGGQRLDLVVTTARGASLAIIVKEWSRPGAAMIEKASREAALLTNVDGIDHSIIVIAGLADADQTDTVVNLGGFRAAVEAWVSADQDFGLRSGFAEDKVPSAMPTKQVFVAMPFGSRFEDTYYVAILPAAEKAGATCVRMDEQYFSEHILKSLYVEIARSDLVIADVTDGNANVTYELGYAHALKKQTIHVSATSPEQLPFDIRQWPAVLYGPGHFIDPSRNWSR